MPEPWQEGAWLIVDAAGPILLTGLLREGRWLARRTTAEGFLESLKPETSALLSKNALSLDALDGCLYASGPGSTLGLRLAAMFLASLMELPSLSHWQCFSYNNLALACASRLDPDRLADYAVAAPWRRDRLHLARFDPGKGLFALSAVDPNFVVKEQLQYVRLGNRQGNLPSPVEAFDYPTDRIPELLASFPQLLEPSKAPRLYSAEEPVFARWNPERHPAK